MKPYYEDATCQIYQGDCIEILPQITERVGLVIADPPYTFGLSSVEDPGKAGAWADLMNNAIFYKAWMSQIRHLLGGRDSAAWIFNSWRSMPVLAKASQDMGWPITSLMVWDKEWIGPGGHVGLRPTYELAALFASGGFQITNRGTPDIWRQKWHSKKPHGHPAEKPTALYERMIQSAPVDGVVLDPFVGSGTTLEAAKRCGVKSIGIESEERWCEVAAQRISQGVLFE